MADASPRHPTVSSEAEQLILVDADDRALGYASKAAAHDGRGLRHRAFSLFIFNGHGELLQPSAPGRKHGA
ncbi:isopentenyl-diphosphate delta-isomerase, partial [Pseudoxanthomonas broegbernensis]